MPICIHCRFPLPTLYTTYSRADDRSLGKGVRLTQCPRCKRFADKYVEHDFVVLFIDLVLIKPQVYRHLLFNRLGAGVDVDGGRGRERRRDLERTGWWKDWDPSIIRLGILLLLFDVYLTWARIEKSAPIIAFPTSSARPSTLELPHANSLAINATDAITSLVTPPTLGERQGANFLASQSILNQYLFFLLLCALETLTFHGIVRFFCTRKWFLGSARKVGLDRGIFDESRADRDGFASTGTSSAMPSRPPSRMHSARPSADSDYPASSQTMPSPFPTTATSTSSIPQNPNSPFSTSFTPPTTKAPTPSQPNTPVRSSHYPASSFPLPPTITTTTISTALLVSSLPNLFPILMVIWAYDLPSSASAVSWAVIVNNIAALEILLDCGVLRAAIVVGLGGVGRWCIGRAMLGMVGLGEGVMGELSSVMVALKAFLDVG